MPKVESPNAELMSITPNALQLIEEAGRVCYKSEDKIDSASAQNFVTRLVKFKHESVLEHASATIKFSCDRGVSHELVRHRLASFSQTSTRYCNYATGKFDWELTFIQPLWVSDDFSDGVSVAWKNSIIQAETNYMYLIKDCHLRPEQARDILPNSLKTEVVVTANFREWRHIFKLRCSPTAHPEMRRVMLIAFNLLYEAVPVVFNDLAYNVLSS